MALLGCEKYKKLVANWIMGWSFIIMIVLREDYYTEAKEVIQVVLVDRSDAVSGLKHQYLVVIAKDQCAGIYFTQVQYQPSPPGLGHVLRFMAS